MMQRSRWFAAVVVSMLGLGACSSTKQLTDPSSSNGSTGVSGDSSGTDATGAPIECGDSCTLGQLATLKGIRIGAAVNSDLLVNDPVYAKALSDNFNAITPENAMKWTIIHPAPDVWDWRGGDAIVDFAEKHNMDVKGTALVWAQEFGNGLPQWLADITDPAEFKAAMIDSIKTEVAHYKGRVSGWDVVNEPLTYNGAEIDRNVFLQRLNIDYIAIAFRAAHEADPDAKLWLNEAFTEYFPARADALFNLVKGLVDQGVPITGVGLQTHLIINSEVPVGSVDSLVLRLRDLGLEVGLSELDVPIGPDRSEADQVELYTQVVGECVTSGCDDITVWGVGDGNTWLDDKGIRSVNVYLRSFANPSNPLLLDREYKPKPAYTALVELLKNL